MSLNTDSIEKYHKPLYRASWGLVVYTVIIIAWGAWVRISGSGDGCGEHWPLCHGAAVPLGATQKTWIEVSHRYSTAIFGLLVLLQIFFVRRFTEINNPARRWVWWTLLFTVTEALIGRSLVKNGLVNESESLSRLIVMPLHLVNTSLLLLSEVMTAEAIRFGTRARTELAAAQRKYLAAILAGIVILLTTGAIAALGSHLLPSKSLAEGLLHDFSSETHLAVRLRVIHPILGLLIPMALWISVSSSLNQQIEQPTQASAVLKHLGLGAAATVFIGLLTLGFLAPVGLKLSHLIAANILVILASRCVFHLRQG
jgi:cytochrome c oxidase assembly protein subunit 15